MSKEHAAWRERLFEHGDRNVAAAVVRAIDTLLGTDGHLLLTDAHERSIAHHLARYLQDGFPGWDVDCEYNRDRHDAKVLRTLPGLPPGREEREVYPDVIVHHRNTDDNLLVIELKKSTNRTSDEYDRAKLRAYRQELGYQHGLFLRVRTGAETPAVTEAWWSEG